MMKNDFEKENIQLSLPVNATFVSAARLTTSNIAYKMGFEIDGIEDIKAAVSEACTYIIKMTENSEPNSYVINFSLREEKLDVEIRLEDDGLIPHDEQNLSLTMIKALVDDLELVKKDDNMIYKIKMSKLKRRSIFEELEG